MYSFTLVVLLVWKFALSKEDFLSYFLTRSNLWESPRQSRGFTSINYRDQELNIDGRPVTSSGYLTDVLNQHARDFVRDAASRGRPFILYLSHKAVHEPFTPPPRHFELYADEPVPCTPGCDDTLVGKPALTRFVPDTTPPEPGRTGLPVESIREQMSLLVSVDSGLGDLSRVLADTGVLDRTIVVLTSDNGYFYREHALADKRWPYEESIRVPLIGGCQGTS